MVMTSVGAVVLPCALLYPFPLRSSRSAHRLATGRNFFDTMDHRHLQAILRRRVRDGVLLRLIGKWLNAGVLEDGSVRHPETGSPQGGVVSPILSNAYLHEVLDTWFEQTVKPRLRGRAYLIRYADDAVLVFAQEDDAR